MRCETQLWLIRHAPVEVRADVIHGPDAPADTSHAEPLRLSGQGCRRARERSAVRRVGRGETALALGLDPVEEPAFREQDFGAWTGRGTMISPPNLAQLSVVLEIARRQPAARAARACRSDRSRPGTA